MEMEGFDLPDDKTNPRIDEKRRCRRSVFRCSYCKYESTRRFNVTRHEERIHTTVLVPRTCCGAVFPTKGEYYLHCEKIHPETRSNAIVSRMKYKIRADMIRIRGRRRDHCDGSKIRRSKRRRKRRKRRFDEIEEDYKDYEDDADEEKEQKVEEKEGRTLEENGTYVLRRRYSDRIRQKDRETRMKSELTFQYSITYSGLDRENIPLASFLDDRAPRKARYTSPTPVVNPSPTKAAICNDTVRSTKELNDPCASISGTTTPPRTAETETSTRNTTITKEERSSAKGEEENEHSTKEEESTTTVLETLESPRRSTSLSESSIASTSSVGNLPTKKFFLQKFYVDVDKTTKQRATAMPLQERNPNVPVVAQSKWPTKASKSSLVSTIAASSPTSCRDIAEKENIQNFGSKLEQDVKVRLDSGIALPCVTILHRDFLSSIDFHSL